MLGKLFSTAASTLSPRPNNTPTSSRPTTTSLCSVQEDLHTKNLLFPDARDLAQSQHDQVFPLSSYSGLQPMPTSAYDVDGDIELDIRDVRIIVMQEETSLHHRALLLFDSHALPPPSSSSTNEAFGPVSRKASRRATHSAQPPRKISVRQNSRPVVIAPENAPNNFGSAFDRNRRLATRSVSSIETKDQRNAREYREEIKTFSDCIFGAQVMAYKGTGTKMHIVPNDAKTSQYGTFANENHFGSFGRSSMRNSKLSQSYTSENLSPNTPGGQTGSIPADRKKILITRTFSVPLLNDDMPDDAQNPTPTLQSFRAGEESGYPFPTADENRAERKVPQPKQKRTPMYAIGLVVTLPMTSKGSPTTTRSASQGPGSYTEPDDSFPSSFNSAKGAGWTMLSGIDSLDSSFANDVDLRVENFTQHWDIVMRTMSQLQAAVSVKLLALLKHADLASPDPSRMVPAQMAGARRFSQDAKSLKPPKTTTKLVQLNPNALAHDEDVQREIRAARRRVVNGIKAQQVVTGQGRWGIWREEARWVGKWAGGREEGFFFFNLLTSFLGNHTEWLQTLGPAWYRRRHHRQQRANRDEDIGIPARTIIIADDKIIARKLIFLLSAFLPADQQAAASRLGLYRPGTSASAGGYSQSPPAYAGPSREESLRRKINKRGSVSRGAHSRTRSFPAQHVQRSNITASMLGVEALQEGRTSDVELGKSANLPIPGREGASRKTSAATTATVTPMTTMPHFSTRSSHRGTGPFPRPGSSGSLVTEDLIRTLTRVESTGNHSATSTDSQGQTSGWGSMLSSLWSSSGSRQRDSTSSTQPPSDGLEINTRLGKKIQPAIKSPSAAKESKPVAQRNAPHDAGAATPSDAPAAGTNERPHSPSLRRAASSSLYDSPVKSSVNEDDGVIDIDVPLPDFLTSSVGSIRSSPSSSCFLSAPAFGNGLEGFEHFPRLENEAPMNVGGWLKQYHSDFTLQAIPSQEGLEEEEIKASMRAEPTPPLGISCDDGSAERWVDVCSTIIADANHFTVKRIRYSRLVRIKPAVDSDMANFLHSTSAPSGPESPRGGCLYTPAQLTPAADAFETTIDEKFVVEPLVGMDETLIDAVERIIAQSGEVSRIPSAASSRSASRKSSKVDCAVRERSNSLSTTANGSVVKTQLSVVKPSECKKLVLLALEEVAKSVAEGRTSGGIGERGESALREGVRRWLTSVEEL